MTHHEAPAAPDAGTIRPETREAWDALIAAGDTPSVRKMHARVGGAYNLLAEECRLLRQDAQLDMPPQDAPPEDTDAPAEDEAPSLPPAASGVPERADAEQALRTAQAALRTAETKRQRLDTQIAEAQQQHEAAQAQVRALLQRVLAEEAGVEHQLEGAYRARDAARFQLEDWQAQTDVLEAERTRAEQAIEGAQATVRLVTYNEFARQRAPRCDAVETACQQLAAALDALLDHDAQQREAARACGFDGLPGDVDSASQRNGFHPLSCFVYDRLQRLLPAPHPRLARRMRLARLAEADAASTPLSAEQAQALAAPTRRHRVTISPDPGAGANFRNLLALVGFPGVLYPGVELTLTDEWYARVRQALPNKVTRLGSAAPPAADTPPGAGQ